MNYEQGIAFCRRIIEMKGEQLTVLDTLVILHNALEGCTDPCHGDTDEVCGAWRWWDARRVAWAGEYPSQEAAQAAVSSAPDEQPDEITLFNDDRYWQLHPQAALPAMREVLAEEACGRIPRWQAVAILYNMTDERLDWDAFLPTALPEAELSSHHETLDAIARQIEAEIIASHPEHLAK